MTFDLRRVRLGTRIKCPCCQAEARFLSSDGKHVEVVWITDPDGEPVLQIAKYEIAALPQTPEVVH